jgi:hypothetical protein
MISKRYARAYKEVVEIYNCLPEEEKQKIPNEKIEFYRNNMDVNYEFAIEPDVPLNEQSISKEASAIIINLFLDYFADDTQKENLKEAFRIIEEMRDKQN